MKSLKDNQLDFGAVIDNLKAFLEPVYEAVINETELQKAWSAKRKNWI